MLQLLDSGVSVFGQFALSSGATVGGSIFPAGSSNVWSFDAVSGDQIILRVGRLSQIGGTLEFRPSLALYGPGGGLIASDSRASVAEVVRTASSSGTYTVMVADGVADVSSPHDGTGTYRLQLARVPGSYVVPAGDEGGWLTNGVAGEGLIELGDLDLWSFNGSPGDNVVLRMSKVTQSGGALGFRPWIRLYTQDGSALGTSEGADAAEIAVTLTGGGTLTVVAADGGVGAGAPFEGTGTYRLTVAGLGGGAELAAVPRSATTLALRAYGGRADALYLVLTTDDVSRPTALWAPILTNRFGADGQSVDILPLNASPRYFRLLLP